MMNQDARLAVALAAVPLLLGVAGCGAEPAVVVDVLAAQTESIPLPLGSGPGRCVQFLSSDHGDPQGYATPGEAFDAFSARLAGSEALGGDFEHVQSRTLLAERNVEAPDHLAEWITVEDGHAVQVVSFSESPEGSWKLAQVAWEVSCEENQAQ